MDALRPHAMAAPVSLTDWETANTKKGKSLTYQTEAILYQVPLPKAFKTAIIDVLDQCKTEFGCQLTVRGRKEDEKKRIKIGEEQGTEVEKIHTIIYTLKLLPRPQQTAEERLSVLGKAERYVDAFLRHMVRCPDDKIYMFPTEQERQASVQKTGEATRPSNGQKKPQ